LRAPALDLPITSLSPPSSHSLPAEAARAAAIAHALTTIQDVRTDGTGRGPATAAAAAAAAAARAAALAAGEVEVFEDEGGGALAWWKNARCPLTGKPLADLADPVADPVGYVYERSALDEMFRQQAQRAAAAGGAARRGGGASRGAAAAAAGAAADPSIRCPVAGATHVLRPGDLRGVRRELKKAAEAAARAAAQRAGGGGGGVVDLDLA